MAARSDVPGFDVLLCEGCGYVVEGLGHDGACPECGKAIGESLPYERAGSAYQVRRGWGSLVRTWAATLVCPKALFARMRVDKKGGMSLMWRGLSTAVSLPLVLLMAASIVMLWDRSAWPGVLHVVMPFVFMGGAYIVVVCAGVVYTTLAVPRIKFIARRRGMRMNNAIAWTIAGQASMGLTLWPLCFALWGLVAAPVMVYAELTEDRSVYGDAWYEVLGVVFSVLLYVSFVFSFVEFEVLLSMGTRRLRYRNPVAATGGEARDAPAGAVGTEIGV